MKTVNKATAIAIQSVILLSHLFIPQTQPENYIKILSFYTNFNHLLFLIFVIWLLYEKCAQNILSRKLQQFTLFVLYSSFLVMVSFWILYSIDQKLILNKNPPPFFALVFLHGGNFLMMIFEIITVTGFPIVYPSYMESVLSLMGYLGFVGLNFGLNNRFPYPFQKGLSLTTNILIIVVSCLLIQLLYSLIKKMIINNQEVKYD